MDQLLDYKTWVEVRQKTLAHNLDILKHRIGTQALLAVIKCNAYGHGLVEMGKCCQEAKAAFLGVDTLDEAIELRQHDITIPILIITYTPKHRLASLLEHNVSQVVYDMDILEEMVRLAEQSGKKFNVHLKVDTGMSRQGISVDAVADFLAFFAAHTQQITLEGVLTHFANADDLHDQHYTVQQLEAFARAIDLCKQRALHPTYVHAANTPGALALSAQQLPPEINMCRIGIGLYGLAPSADFQKMFAELGLQSVLTWKTRIIQIKTIEKGSFIGYGTTEQAEKDLRIAVLPVGYYEGIPRSYSSVGHVLIGGKRCKILGRVSMSLTVVDITDVPVAPNVWDEVVIIGKQGDEEITADEFAKKTNTINYEIVTRINPLIKRIVV